MNPVIAEIHEAAQDWVQLGTEFIQQQSQLFQPPLNSTAVPSARSVAASFVNAAQQADEFVVKAVKLADTQGQKLLDAVVAQHPAKAVLAPATISAKNASQAVVTLVEQVVAAKKSLYRQAAAA